MEEYVEIKRFDGKGQGGGQRRGRKRYVRKDRGNVKIIKGENGKVKGGKKAN